MSEYIDPPLEQDPAEILADLVDAMQAAYPGWEPVPSALDYQLLSLVASVGAATNQTASSMLTSAFRWFGLYLVPDAQPEDAVAATGQVTITFTDTAAHTIDAGTTYGVQLADQILGFQLVDDLDHAAGTNTEAGVDVVADTPGTIGNGQTGELVQVDSLGYVESVEFEAATDGGVDAEDDPTYLDRLRGKLRLQAPRPIVPPDFAAFPLDVPGVWRAVAIDGYDPADHASYDPDDPGTWKERYVTVAVIDVDGEDPGAAVRTEVDTLFNGDASAGILAKREVNFVVPVEVPTYTTFDVTWTGVAWPQYAPADVEAAGDAAVSAFLAPSAWGNPGVTGEARGWENVRQLTVDGLYAALRAVPGMRNVSSVTFRKGASAFASTAVTLDGSPGPVLTRPGVISGTVT